MKLTTIIFSILLTNNVLAFDRIYCQSDLKGWVISLTESTQTAVLTPYNQNATFTEAQSQKFIVKGAAAETVITIFPWNSLYVRVPEKTKSLFEIKSKEVSDGFFIEIIDKATKISRSLNCGFTF